MAELLRNDLGRMPLACDILSVDGAPAEVGMEPTRHKTIDLAGCGTNPAKGREQFRKYWSELQFALDEIVRHLGHCNKPFEYNPKPAQPGGDSTGETEVIVKCQYCGELVKLRVDRGNVPKQIVMRGGPVD
ncbi:MAG: hypothetical protein O3A00_02370 [Planctomycetota bacterium]|nr:hypothetical protein [Planctomycetota bacterium]